MMLNTAVVGFGKARFKGEKGDPVTQSRHYCAPEAIANPSLARSFSNDMWAVGCTIMEPFLGRVLFPSVSY